MDTQTIVEYMEGHKKGSVRTMSARERIDSLPFGAMGWAPERVADLLRRGYPEVVCCLGLDNDEMQERLGAVSEKLHDGLLCYNANEDTFAMVSSRYPDAVYHPAVRMISLAPHNPLYTGSRALVISDGKDDFTVSEEVSIACETMGVAVVKFYNVSEADVDTLMSLRSALRTADIALVVSGNGASLASQIRKQTEQPVLAVPASHSKASGGLAAMMAVAETCTRGVTLCGTDNSYGAAWLAGALYA